MWTRTTTGGPVARDLGTLAQQKDNQVSLAASINNFDQVVGWSFTDTPDACFGGTQQWGFVWQGGRMRALPTLDGDCDAEATRGNIFGTIVGDSLGAAVDGSHHAIGKRPFFVGLVHGFAGSAALMLFVLTTITNPWMGLLYVLIFGGGTIGGMLVMSTVIGLPFALANRVFAGLVGKIQFAAGLGSLGFGIFYAWRIALELRIGF